MWPSSRQVRCASNTKADWRWMKSLGCPRGRAPAEVQGWGATCQDWMGECDLFTGGNPDTDVRCDIVCSLKWPTR